MHFIVYYASPCHGRRIGGSDTMMDSNVIVLFHLFHFNFFSRLLEPNATLATTWTPTLAHYSTYSCKELLPVVCRLALALTKRDDSKLKVKIFSTL